MTFLTYVEVSTKPPVPINIAHRAHAATSLDGIDGDGERMQQSLGAGWRRRSLNASSVELGNVHRKMEEEGRKFERERTWCCGKREGNRLNYGAIFQYQSTLWHRVNFSEKTLVLFFFFLVATQPVACILQKHYLVINLTTKSIHSFISGKLAPCCAYVQLTYHQSSQTQITQYLRQSEVIIQFS